MNAIHHMRLQDTIGAGTRDYMCSQSWVGSRRSGTGKGEHVLLDWLPGRGDRILGEADEARSKAQKARVLNQSNFRP
jgi:hypothetical protein